MAPEMAESWADGLIDRFGSLGRVLAASPAAQHAAVDGNMAASGLLATLRSIMLETLQHEAHETPCIPTSRALRDYLHIAMAHQATEHFRILFLASDHRLIADEVIALGTIAEVPMYPREIVRRALELGAIELILVHNHPSGNPSASPADLAATRHVVDAARPLGITVIDHIIIAQSGWSSMRDDGYL